MYIQAIADTQHEIGSRLIWSGEVDAQVVGTSDPVFQSDCKDAGLDPSTGLLLKTDRCQPLGLRQ